MTILSAALLILLSTASIAFAQKLPIVVYLAGDSTMAPKRPDRRPETGWGEMLEKHFKNGKVRVENRALNGRSTRSFIAEGHWQKVVDDLKKGDYVFIQFGHNDPKEGTDRYASPDDYRKNLVRFVSDVRAKGGNPVLFTPVMRRRFDKDGKFFDSHKEYPGIVREVSREEKVPLIDMHKLSEAVIVRYGKEDSRRLFLHLKPGESPNYPNGVEDDTHFSPLGADEMAKLAVKGIEDERVELKKYLTK